jgi:hypothetical protein
MASAHPLNRFCSHCVRMVQLHPVPPAPSGAVRHPDSSQKVRKQGIRCAGCHRTNGPGVTLRYCAACQSDLYCVSKLLKLLPAMSSDCSSPSRARNAVGASIC